MRCTSKYFIFGEFRDNKVQGMNKHPNKEPIKQELSEILAKYYDGSFARLVQEYIRISGMTEEEREGLMETMRSLNQQSL